MKCPNCHNENKQSLLTCNQCASSFCQDCQPYDHEGDICQQCQEFNSIEAGREESLTDRMRRWFSKAAPAPTKPELVTALPWKVIRSGAEWHLVSATDETQVVARLDDLPSAQYACDAANAFFQLSMVATVTYNRIRNGDVFWTGSKQDCTTWLKLKEILFDKPNRIG